MLEPQADNKDYSLQGILEASIAISLKRIADRLDWDYEDRVRERLGRHE